jgi:hypothetical protein
MITREDLITTLQERKAQKETSQDTVGLDEDTALDIPSQLDARMSELPDNQKEFFLDHLTPETLAMIGLILGDPAIEFFQPMTDMNKKMSVTDRELTSVDSDEESLDQVAQPETIGTSLDEPEGESFTI